MIGLDGWELASTLSTAMLHFLWQGALVAVLAGGALFALRRGSPQSRYLVACTALATSFGLFLATFVLALTAQSALAAPLDIALLAQAIAADAGMPSLDVLALALIWLLGTAFVATRTARQWLAARSLRQRDVSPVAPELQDSFALVCRQMGVNRAVRLAQSGIAEVPMVIGWLSPIVLVPSAMLRTLPAPQLRAILAHEIAHIRRHDYLINSLQKGIETVLFFHPAVWWLSHRIRIERERCCDDEAVRLTGDALLYANALYQLETIRIETSPLALAANGGSIMDRIRRILASNPSRPANHPSLRGRLVAVVAVVAIAATAAGIANLSFDGPAAIPIVAQTADPSLDKDASLSEAYADKLAATAAEKNLTTDEVEALWEQAALKKAALTATDKELAAKKAATKDKKPLSLDELADQLDAAVVAGKLTVEEAEAKLLAAQTGGDKKDAPAKTAGKETLSLDDWAQKFDAMVESGKLSAEEAEAKLAALAALGGQDT